MSRFYETCLEILDLKKPITLTYVDAKVVKMMGQTAEGFCLSLPSGHSIKVAKRGAWGKKVLLAHELCHAAVRETSPRAKTHGRKFQRMCRYLEESLKERGYTLKYPLYDPRTDL